MKNFKIGENFTIHCYKHDGTIHRTWDEAVLLATHKDYLVFGNRNLKLVIATVVYGIQKNLL